MKVERAFAAVSILIIGAFFVIPALVNFGHAHYNVDRGEQRYRIECQNCHALPQFDRMNSAEWNAFLKEHTKDKNIPKEYWDEIVDYLQRVN